MTFNPRQCQSDIWCRKEQISTCCTFNALRNAGIDNYNLVQVSTILPANCKYTSETGTTAVAVSFFEKDGGVVFESSLIDIKNGLEDAQEKYEFKQWRIETDIFLK